MQTNDAFVPPNLLTLSSINQSRLTRSPTRRPRRATTIYARSMDSYRDGSRFADSERQPLPRLPSRPSGGSSNRQSQAPKQTTTILKALMLLNVASQETCAFLIRSSCIRVNGTLVNDGKTSVNRLTDTIMLNGKDLGTVEHGTDHVDQWSERAPRTHRDHPRSDLDSLGRQFNRRVDDGFFSTKKYNSSS